MRLRILQNLETVSFRRQVEIEYGDTLSCGALINATGSQSVPGGCACATCHVNVDEAFMEKVDRPVDMEQSRLDFAKNV
ncbi:hypothetical protein [Hyphomonas sp. CY54-11-8]|uniref:hypothetical protein n=1 Tax=Hyphomonas sp. CY54-11-8 TaxID=1280944 RepID=UPI000AD33189|nr:hypothetical protein [Hyphomonas sp. CY54-11-8]